MTFLLFLTLAATIAYLLSRLRFQHLAHTDDLHDLRAEIDRLRQQLQQNPNPPSDAIPINLNTANKTTLQRIPKVGAACAKRIMDARPFESMEQLTTLDGLTEEQRQNLRARGCL